jgi:MFS family permease
MQRRQIEARGWIRIAGAVLGVAVTVIPVAILPLSVFLKPLNAAFGWGRGEIALALTFLSLAMAAAMPIAGWLIDKYGTRWPALGSLLLYALGILLLPWAIREHGIAGFYAGACWIGFMGSASSSIAYVKLLSGWFNQNRGLALGFAMSGIAVGGATMPMFAAHVIDLWGWQAGFYGLAAMPILVGIPVVVGLTRYTLDPIEALTPAQEALASGAADQQGMTASEAVRGRTFAILLAVFLIAATSLHGIQIHLPALLSDGGVGARMSVAALSLMFVFSVLTRLVAGYLFDRFFAPLVGAACFAAAAVGAMALAIGDPTAVIVIAAAILLGVGAGAESDLLALLVSRYFGMRAFGRIYGFLFASFMAGSALGPFVLGAAFDALDDYDLALYWCAGGLVVVAALLACLPRYPQAAAELESVPSKAVAV